MANKVTIEIDGKNQGAVKAINGVNTELLNMDKLASGVTRGMGSLGGVFSSMVNPAFLLGTGITALIGGFTAMIGKSLQLADDLNEMSQKTGVSVEALSQLKYAAELSETSLDALEGGLIKMSKAVYEARSGNKDMAESFKLLDVSLKDNEGRLKNNEQIFTEVTDKISKMGDGSTKTALSLKIFGRSSSELIPLLNEGADGLDEMRRAADQMGKTISTQTAKDVDALMDEMTRFKAMMEGLAVQSLPLVTKELTVLGYTLDLLSKDPWELFKQLALGLDNKKLEEYRKGLLKVGEAVRDTAKEDEKIESNLARQNAEAQRLNKNWEDIGRKLKLDINAFGLDPQEEKMLRLVTQAEEYKQKFASIPGALSTINDYLLTQLFTITQLNQAKPAEQPGAPSSGFGMSGVDITLLQSMHDQQLALAADVTDQELAMYLLREGAFTDMLGNMAGAMQTFATLSGNSNKTLFGIYKAFGIAEAGVATYLAATKALAEVPYPFNFAAAAAVTAAGLANIARIASMQPGGGVSGANPLSPPSSGSVSNIRNETNNNSKSIVVNVYGFVGMDKDAIARELAPAIEKAWKDDLGNG